MMSDKEIKAAIDSGQLVIDPFLLECLQPSSYDLSLGEVGYLSGETRTIDIEGEGLELRPGQFALVTTCEKLTMPQDMSAYIGVSSEWIRKGLLLLHGLQVDAGFNTIS